MNVLWDMVGFSGDGETPEQFQAIQEAVRQNNLKTHEGRQVAVVLFNSKKYLRAYNGKFSWTKDLKKATLWPCKADALKAIWESGSYDLAPLEFWVDVQDKERIPLWDGGI